MNFLFFFGGWSPAQSTAQQASAVRVCIAVCLWVSVAFSSLAAEPSEPSGEPKEPSSRAAETSAALQEADQHEFLMNCETPPQIYDRLDGAQRPFQAAFKDLYKDRKIPDNCWFLRVGEVAPRSQERHWKMRLKVPGRQHFVSVKTTQNLSDWTQGQCVKIYQGKLMKLDPLGRFEIEGATLVKAKSQACDT